MSILTTNDYSNITILPENQWFDGENYVSWRDIMLMVGRIKGLDLYWEGKVIVPSEPILERPMIPKKPIPTAINDPFPSYLEYKLYESIAFITLWNNIKDPVGLGILVRGTLWQIRKHLKIRYQTVGYPTQQRREDAL